MRAPLLLAVALLTLTACAPLPEQGSEVIVPDVPAGFEDTGEGIAYRFSDADVDCDEYTVCATIEVFAYDDCPTSVTLAGSLYDEDDQLVDEARGNSGPLASGASEVIVLGSYVESATSFGLEEAHCR